MIDRQPIVEWIKNYVHQSGRKKVVVGISGGIDSALTTCLAVEALGKENVIGVMMPFGTLPKTDKRANLPIQLAANLDIQYGVFSIDDAVLSLSDTFHTMEAEPHNASNLLPIQERRLMLGNAQARVRMTALYMYAETHKALVIGTTNKTEMIIGYYTKYGDGGVDFEPISGLYKTQVYEVAKQYPEIPVGIIGASPSAELWEGQTDEDELGITYANLDLFLKEGVHNLSFSINDKHPVKVSDIQFEPRKEKVLDYISIEQAKRILDLIKSTDHKRKQPPCFGTDNGISL